MDASAWFIDAVTVKTYDGGYASSYGDSSYGNSSTVYGRLESSTALVEQPDGTVLQASYSFVTATAFNLKDIVWLSGADTSVQSQARRVLRVDTARTKGGGYRLYRVLLA